MINNDHIYENFDNSNMSVERTIINHSINYDSNNRNYDSNNRNYDSNNRNYDSNNRNCSNINADDLSDDLSDNLSDDLEGLPLLSSKYGSNSSFSSNYTNSSTDSTNRCIICFNKVNCVKKYCLCKNGSEIIHHECLIKWINIRYPSNLDNAQCGICKQKYNIKYYSSYKIYCFRNVLSVLFMALFFGLLMLYYVVLWKFKNFSNAHFTLITLITVLMFLVIIKIYIKLLEILDRKNQFVVYPYINVPSTSIEIVGREGTNSIENTNRTENTVSLEQINNEDSEEDE